MAAKPGIEWVKPGIVATIKHLKGEEKLRHATVKAVKAGQRSEAKEAEKPTARQHRKAAID